MTRERYILQIIVSLATTDQKIITRTFSQIHRFTKIFVFDELISSLRLFDDPELSGMYDTSVDGCQKELCKTGPWSHRCNRKV